MRPLLLAAVVLALAGCDSAAPAAAGDLVLDVRGDRFLVGAEAEATVENRSGRALYLYDCGGRILLGVQERTREEWETSGFVNGDCPTVPVVPYRLGAGEERAVEFTVERPGTYRLRTAFGAAPGPGTDVGGPDWAEAVSGTFSVRAE